MSKIANTLNGTLIRFKNDRRGMEAIQAVLLVAVAAIMMFGVLQFFKGDITEKVNQGVNQVLDTTSNLNEPGN